MDTDYTKVINFYEYDVVLLVFATKPIRMLAPIITAVGLCTSIENVNCVATGTRNELLNPCPVCCSLFQAESELCDRRPVIACHNGDTICADCVKKCQHRSDAKCPTCGVDLLNKHIVVKALMGMISECVILQEISAHEIQMEDEPFARGGFADVYKAIWGDDNVVIKAIRTETEEEKQMVRHEANITLRLNHENVVKLFGITRVKQKQLGIVMELAESGSLDKWIGKIGHGKTATIALGVIDGLDYVHSQKVIHRDIKPRNILMFGPEDDMFPKIADFGVSKVIQTAVTPKTKVGEDLYMAPEVKMFSRYSFPADIFSLAIMLFEMFNRQLIRHSSQEIQSFIVRVHSGRIGEIPENCEVPENLHDVIISGWDEDPEKRPTLSMLYAAINGKCFLLLHVCSRTCTFSCLPPSELNYLRIQPIC